MKRAAMGDPTEFGGGASPLKMIARLVWEQDGVKKAQPIAGDGLTIGRSSQNNLPIDDLGASRFHCKLLPDSGGLLVVDLDSTNGTYVNEQCISGSQKIVDGDEIRIGSMTFKVEVHTHEPPPQEQPQDERTQALEEGTFIVPAQAVFPWLVVSSGMGKGTVIPLNRPSMQIGRASRDRQWDIDLVDRAISRPHAELVKGDGGWVLTDLDSANGTSVNGNCIEAPQSLKNGDVIELGETVLVFREPVENSG